MNPAIVYFVPRSIIAAQDEGLAGIYPVDQFLPVVPNDEYHAVRLELERVTAERDAALKTLEALLERDELNTCLHENTHRGGAIWEICDDCGANWADDQGGKPAWKDPQEWIDARALIAKVRAAIPTKMTEVKP